jgi:hypothetical protein
MQEEDEGCAEIIWSISEGWKCWFGRQECCMNTEQSDKWGGGCAGGGGEGVLPAPFPQTFKAYFA